jgi:ATP-dependent Lon protease
VVFPGTAVPISAGRPGTLQAIEAALAGDRRMLAVAQRENRDEVDARTSTPWAPWCASPRCSAATAACSC